MDVININKELEINSEFDLIMIKDNIENINKIQILELCGKGGYGIVYKCIFKGKTCAIKLSKNEKYSILNKRYKSIKKCLGNSLTTIYYSGKLHNNKKYNYYGISEFGGISLKEYINNKNIDICTLITNLCDIIENIKKNKLLIPDFKLSNLLIDEKKKLRLTDIFMECANYSPCYNCAIVRTYCVIDITKDMYENKTYNYSYIYTLSSFALINILCKRSLSSIISKLSKEYDIDSDLRNMTILLQYASYEYYGDKNNEIINYYIKKKDYNFDIKSFYKKFLDLLSVKNEYINYISNSEFRQSITILLIPDFELRSLESIKNKFK